MRGGTGGPPDACANSSIHPGAGDALQLTAPVAGTLLLPDRPLVEKKRHCVLPSLAESFLEMIGGVAAGEESLFVQNLQFFKCGSPTCSRAGSSMLMIVKVQLVCHVHVSVSGG